MPIEQGMHRTLAKGSHAGTYSRQGDAPGFRRVPPVQSTDCNRVPPANCIRLKIPIHEDRLDT